MKSRIISFIVGSLALCSLSFASPPVQAPKQIKVNIFIPTVPQPPNRYCQEQGGSKGEVISGCTVNAADNSKFDTQKMFLIHTPPNMSILKIGAYIPIYNDLSRGEQNFKLSGCSDDTCFYEAGESHFQARIIQ